MPQRHKKTSGERFIEIRKKEMDALARKEIAAYEQALAAPDSAPAAPATPRTSPQAVPTSQIGPPEKKQEINSLLSFADHLQDKCDDVNRRIELNWTMAAGVTTATLALIATLFAAQVPVIAATGFLYFILAAHAVGFVVYFARRYYLLHENLSRDTRIVLSIADLLRELGPAIENEFDLSTVERATLSIRLSRFGIGDASQDNTILSHGELLERQLDMAEESPSASVLDAWASLERSIEHTFKKITRFTWKDKGRKSVDELVTYRIVNRDTASLINELREMRDIASHSPQGINKNAAKTYASSPLKYSRTPKTPRKNPLKNEVVCSGFEYFNGLLEQ